VEECEGWGNRRGDRGGGGREARDGTRVVGGGES